MCLCNLSAEVFQLIKDKQNIPITISFVKLFNQLFIFFLYIHKMVKSIRRTGLVLKRIITYLYEYNNGKKCNNMGFLKVDLRGNNVRMEIHMQGGNRKPEQGVAYLIVKGKEIAGVELGELDIKPENSITIWNFSSNQIMGSPFELAQVIGVGVLFPSGKYIASSWVDTPGEVFARGNFSVWKPIEQEKEPQLSAASVAVAAKERNTVVSQGEWKVHQGSLSRASDKSVRDNIAPEPQHKDTVSAAKPEQKDPASPAKPEQKDPEKSAKPEQKDPVSIPESGQKDSVSIPESGQKDPMSILKPDMPTETSSLRRIDISDIRSLPKRNWYLCNNSFLIHGFFNYHYLVLWEKEEDGVKKTYLGVPGIYERPERAMALLFGFPEFATEETVAGGEPEPSEAVTGSFGYWLCLLNL